MKYLLLCVLLSLSSSCVATTGDLANLSAAFTASLETLDEEVKEAAESGEDTSVAFDKAIADMGAAVSVTVGTIEERVEAIRETVAVVADKTTQGPSGWLELLAMVGSATAAGGFGLNHYRNNTRAKELDKVKAGADEASV